MERPVAVLEPLLVDPNVLVKVVFEDLIERRLLGVARTVEGSVHRAGQNAPAPGCQSNVSGLGLQTDSETQLRKL